MTTADRWTTRYLAATGTSSTAGNWSLYSNWSNGTSGTATARTGSFSTSTSSTAVTGTGTLFLTELSVGNYLYKGANGAAIGEVASITSNTALTLVANSLLNHNNNISSSGVAPIDTVVIANGHTMTVNASNTCDSLVFSTTGGTVTVNNTFTLTVTRAITIPSTAGASNSFTIAGQGTISCARFRVGNGAPTPVSTQTTKLVSTISAFNISGDLIFTSYYAAGPFYNNPVFELQSGTLDVNGQISTSNPDAGNSSTFTTATGAQSGTLKLEYAGNPFSPSGTGTTTLTLNGTSATVNYVYKIADNITSGEEKWSCNAAQQVTSGPIYYNGTVYFGSNGGKYYAVNSDNASGTVRPLWPYSAASGNATSGPWLDLINSRVIFGTTGGNLDAFVLDP